MTLIADGFRGDAGGLQVELLAAGLLVVCVIAVIAVALLWFSAE